MNRRKHNIGDKFGRLTISKILPNRIVEAECECGKVKEYHFNNITSGKTSSCGCYNSELNFKHGGCAHPLYTVWEGICQRCYSKNHQNYKNYGGKGVTMCNEWKEDFGSFKKWALDNGWKKGLKVDKDIKAPKTGPKIYSPDHCSIITHQENLRNKVDNKIIEYNGVSLCLTEWSEVLGIKYCCLRARIDRGWDTERAFTKQNFTHNQKRKVA